MTEVDKDAKGSEQRPIKCSHCGREIPRGEEKWLDDKPYGLTCYQLKTEDEENEELGL